MKDKSSECRKWLVIVIGTGVVMFVLVNLLSNFLLGWHTRSSEDVLSLLFLAIQCVIIVATILAARKISRKYSQNTTNDAPIAHTTTKNHRNYMGYIGLFLIACTISIGIAIWTISGALGASTQSVAGAAFFTYPFFAVFPTIASIGFSIGAISQSQSRGEKVGGITSLVIGILIPIIVMIMFSVIGTNLPKY